MSPKGQNQPYLRHPLSECILHSVVARKSRTKGTHVESSSIDDEVYFVWPHICDSVFNVTVVFDAFGDGVYFVSSISVAAWNEK